MWVDTSCVLTDSGLQFQGGVGGGESGQLGLQPSPPPCNPLGFEMPSPTLPPTSRPPWYSPNLPAQRSEWVLAFT